MPIQIGTDSSQTVLGYIYREKKMDYMPYCDLYRLTDDKVLLLVHEETTICQSDIHKYRRLLAKVQDHDISGFLVPEIIEENGRLGFLYPRLDGSLIMSHLNGKYNFREVETIIEDLFEKIASVQNKIDSGLFLHPSQIHILPDGTISLIPSLFWFTEFDYKSTLYCPPELFSASQSTQSDIYSLGLIVLQLFCDVLPWESSPLSEVNMNKVLPSGEDYFIQHIREVEHLTDTEEKTLIKMINAKPEERFASLKEALQSFRGIQDLYEYWWRVSERFEWDGPEKASREDLQKLIDQGYEVKWKDGDTLKDF